MYTKKVDKRPKQTVVSPGLIHPWPVESFKYYPKFNLGVAVEWMGLDSIPQRQNSDTKSGSRELFLGFEADFIENIDMSVFDCFALDECEPETCRVVSAPDVPAEESES